MDSVTTYSGYGQVDLDRLLTLAAAIAAQATFLATYDRKHLLRKKDQIKQHFSVIAAAPDEALRAEGWNPDLPGSYPPTRSALSLYCLEPSSRLPSKLLEEENQDAQG